MFGKLCLVTLQYSVKYLCTHKPMSTTVVKIKFAPRYLPALPSFLVAEMHLIDPDNGFQI